MTPAVTQQPLSDITAIANYLGQYSQQLIGNIYNKLNLTEFASVIPNLTAPRILVAYRPHDGVRPLDIDVENTTLSQGEFETRSIDPRFWMRVLKIRPHEFVQTYLSEQINVMSNELATNESIAGANVPGAIGKNSMASMFWRDRINWIGKEIANNHYFGVDRTTIPLYNAGTAYNVGDVVKFMSANNGNIYARNIVPCTGVAPLVGDTIVSTNWVFANNRVLVDGWGTIIKKEILAGTISGPNLIPLGALTNTNAFEKIDQEFYFSIPEEIRMNADKIQLLMSDNTFQKRRINLVGLNLNSRDSIQYTGDLSQKRDGFDFVHGTNQHAEIRVVPWMAGSDRIIANVHYEGNKNLVVGFDRDPSEAAFGNIVNELHGYRCAAKGTLAFQIADPKVMFVNELA
jgi:hypothetical protein